MISLIRKEIRELRPILVLMLAFVLFGYGLLPFFERVDEITFFGLCATACEPGIDYYSAWISLLLIVLTAYCLFPREQDSGTLKYLSSLPITFWQIFVAKILAAFILLVSFELFAYLIVVALVAMNPDSIEGVFYHGIELSYITMIAVFNFVVLCHGVLLSWFRMIGIVVYALVVLSIEWFHAVREQASLFNLFELLRHDYHAQTLQLPVTAMVLHTLLASVAVLLAYRLWHFTATTTVTTTVSNIKSDHARARNSDSGHKISLRYRAKNMFSRLKLLNSGVLLICSVLAISITAIAYRFIQQPEGEWYEIEQLQAGSYSFKFRRADRTQVNNLILTAEADNQQLKTMLGVSTDFPIVVDATRTSKHFAGTAGWKRIRIDLSGSLDLLWLRRVLSHESVHVYQSNLSKGRAAKYQNSLKFFIEGMAEHYSYRIVTDEEKLQWSRLVASLGMQRLGITLDDLADHRKMVARFAEDLIYPMGEVWVQALVNSCDEMLAPDLLLGLEKQRLPSSLEGKLWWRTVLQQHQCDLGAVENEWARLLLSPSLTSQLRYLPQLQFESSEYNNADDTIISYFKADIDNSELDYLLRVKANPDDKHARTDVFLGTSIKSETGKLLIRFEQPASLLQGRYLHQVGFKRLGKNQPFYQEWKKAIAPEP